MIAAELAALVESNAWTFGPNATALRVLRLTHSLRADPETFWEPLLEACPRMAPLGYWRAAIRATGRALLDLEEDFLRRHRLLVQNLAGCIGRAGNVLIVGHDLEIDGLWLADGTHRSYRYLLLDGHDHAEPPGASTARHPPGGALRVEPPLPFERLEEALDWADAVVLAGFVLHRQNVLGPPQLRPLLTSASDQVDAVVLCVTNERRLTLGEGGPRRYTEDFRPYLWQAAVTHLVSEWHSGAGGVALGWLPMPAEVLIAQFGETLFHA